MKGSPGVKATKIVILMVVHISELAIQAVLREVLHSAENQLYVTSMLETLASEVQTRWPELRAIHANCVAWYEQNAVAAATEARLDEDLVAVLNHLSELASADGRDTNFQTVGGICHMSEMWFQDAKGSSAEILEKFKNWIFQTIPEKDYIMFGVFYCRGLDPYDTTAIIRNWVNPE